MWQALLGPVIEMGKSWIQGKAEEQKVKQEVKLEKLKTDAVIGKLVWQTQPRTLGRTNGLQLFSRHLYSQSCGL